MGETGTFGALCSTVRAILVIITMCGCASSEIAPSRSDNDPSEDSQDVPSNHVTSGQPLQLTLNASPAAFVNAANPTALFKFASNRADTVWTCRVAKLNLTEPCGVGTAGTFQATVPLAAAQGEYEFVATGVSGAESSTLQSRWMFDALIELPTYSFGSSDGSYFVGVQTLTLLATEDVRYLTTMVQQAGGATVPALHAFTAASANYGTSLTMSFDASSLPLVDKSYMLYVKPEDKAGNIPTQVVSIQFCRRGPLNCPL